MPRSVTIRCPGCGAPAEAELESIIDVRRRPQDKESLLDGRLNSARCAACGAVSAVPTPILYHDADRELLLAFVPAELNMNAEQRDRVTGDLLRQLTASLPRGEFRGYMFQPKQALTLQGLIEQILEGDGITKEMLAEQESRVRLLERLAQAGPERLEALVREHDAGIDAEFFQAAQAMTQQAAQEGREELVNILTLIQEQAARHSTFGRRLTQQAEARERVLREVAARIEKLGEQPTVDMLLGLVIGMAGEEEQLQALVGLIRPTLDYRFFQELTLRIGQAPATRRASLETLRERLLELTRMVDAQAQAAVQRAAQALQAVMEAADVDQALRERAALLDNTFLAVLSANLREAGKRADIQASGRLKLIHSRLMALMKESMPPAMRFLNELLGASSEREALAMLDAGLARFDDSLLEVMDEVGHALEQQGQEALKRRLSLLRSAAGQTLKRRSAQGQ